MSCISVIFASRFKNEYFEQLVLTFIPHRRLEDIMPEHCAGFPENLSGFAVLLFLGHAHGVDVRSDDAANEFFQRECVPRKVRKNLVPHVRGLRQLIDKLLKGERYHEQDNTSISDMVAKNMYHLTSWTALTPGGLSGTLETNLHHLALA